MPNIFITIKNAFSFPSSWVGILFGVFMLVCFMLDPKLNENADFSHFKKKIPSWALPTVLIVAFVFMGYLWQMVSFTH